MARGHARTLGCLATLGVGVAAPQGGRGCEGRPRIEIGADEVDEELSRIYMCMQEGE